MLGKKALRLATAAVMVGVAMGGQYAAAANAHHAGKTTPTGIIVATDWQEPDGCGPAFGGTVVDADFCNMLGNNVGLFITDNHAQTQPYLAASVPTFKNGGAKVVNGNTVVTYKLRPNLKWSDGTPITMNDFKFSVALNLAIGATFGINQIKSINVLDPLTAQVTMIGSYVPFAQIAQPTWFVPQHYLQQKYKSTNIATIAAGYANDTYNSPADVTCGPFKIQSWSSDDTSVILVPDPNWNGPRGSSHPLPAEVKYVNITTSESTLAADAGSSQAGFDKAEDFQLNDLPVLQQARYHLTNQAGLEFEHLELNSSSPQLKDVRVRQALQDAINKHSLVQQLFPAVKDATPFLMHSVIPSFSSYADTSLPVDYYNPAKAKALLQAAGYSTSYNGPGKHVLLRFYTTAAAIRQKDAEIISKMWAAVGVHTVQNFIPASGNQGLFSAYQSNGILYQRRFDVALFAFSIAPDPTVNENTFDPSLIPTATNHVSGVDQNYTGANGEEWTLLKQGRYATDLNQRHAIFNQWQALMNQQVYYIPLYNRPNMILDDGKIGNLLPNPSNAENHWNAYQWYVKGAS